MRSIAFVVPSAYHSFFSTSAEVAGTLVGLLFVAISLSSERLDGSDVTFQVKASVAFAALTNALVIALVAGLPGSNLATTGIVLSAAGLSSALGLALVSFRHDDRRQRLRVLSRVASLVLLFSIQLVYAIILDIHPHHTGSVEAIGIVVIASFVFAIERAWELVGGGGGGIVTRLARRAVDRAGRPGSPPSASDGDRSRDGTWRP